MRTPQAVTSLITTYGVEIRHVRRPEADAQSPWKVSNSGAGQPVIFKGLIQRLKADQRDRLPEGGIKAVMIILLDKGQKSPQPGDELKVEGVGWRAATVLPLSERRASRLMEVMVTRIGAHHE